MSSIAVVDDRPDVRGVVVEMLREAGYEVCEFDGGKEALNFLRAGNPIDLMLSDQNMPNGISGVELLQTVRQEFSRVATLLMTGSGDPLDLKDMKVRVLVKPVRYRELVETVEAHLMGHQPA